MESTKNPTYNIGTSIFWILIMMIALSGMVFLCFWAYQNNSVQASILGFMFTFMIFTGIIYSKFEIFSIGTWKENSSSFTLGFLVWSGIGFFTSLKSVLSTPPNQLFSTVSGEMPQLLNYLMTVYVIPISEELFWVVALPYVVFSILDQLGKTWKLASNFIFQLVILVIIAGVSFATFHIAKLNWGFLISAFIFRGIMIAVPWADMKIDAFKNTKLIISFALGAHIANNMFAYGFSEGATLLLTNFFTVGWIVIVLFAVIFLTALNNLIEVLFLPKVS